MCVRAASWQNIIYSIRIGAVYCILCLSCEIHCSMYANARTEYHSRSGLATCKSIVKIKMYPKCVIIICCRGALHFFTLDELD